MRPPETDSPEMIRPFAPEMMRPPETDSPEKDLAANKNLPVITNRSSKTTTRAKRFRLMGATRAYFSFLFLDVVSFSGAQGCVISGKSVFGGRIIFGRKRPYYFGHPLYAGLSKKNRPCLPEKFQRFRFVFWQKGVLTHLKRDDYLHAPETNLRDSGFFGKKEYRLI